VIVAASLVIGMISLVISLANILVDFPAQLFDIAEKEEENLFFSLQAEEATRTWEDKLAIEVSENIKILLKESITNPANPNPGMEAPSLVINKVIVMERAAMEQRIGYIEHYITMSEEDKARRVALREGDRSMIGQKKDAKAEANSPKGGSDDDGLVVDEAGVNDVQLEMDTVPQNRAATSAKYPPVDQAPAQAGAGVNQPVMSPTSAQ
jgi:hypothetical protein